MSCCISNDGGIPLERCALIDDGRACALEYNLVRWGKTELAPGLGSLSTFGVRAASSLESASTTTPTLRLVPVTSASEPLTSPIRPKGPGIVLRAMAVGTVYMSVR
jgi:hypothetical protein